MFPWFRPDDLSVRSKTAAGAPCSGPRILFAPRQSLIAVPLSLALSAPVSAQVFVGTSASGDSVVLSNFQTAETPSLLVSAPPDVSSPRSPALAAQPRTDRLSGSKADRWRDVIDTVATSVGVSPGLIHAVISAESNYEPLAVSSKGAVGLMQLMPATARRFGIADPRVARDNVYAGASYLKWLMHFFRGDVELVLAAYNAGEQAVVRAGHKVPQYPETQAYVKRVMAELRASGTVPL